MAVVLLGTLATAAPFAGQAPQSAPARAPSGQTALDRYVATPDSNFTWKAVRELPAAEGMTATLIEMTSQQWLTDKEVERPLWTHWITVVRPATVTSDVGLLFIGGGSNDRQPPARPAAWLIDAARDTGTVSAELRLVPNQPVIFKDDPTRKPRSEDDFIAYTWDKFLRTGDEKWPARLPMTKSAVRAMDAITAFAATAEGGAKPVTRFVVSGASKRGWTTWTTAAVDRRVIAIAPAGDRHAEHRAVVHPSLAGVWRLVRRRERLRRAQDHGLDGHAGVPRAHADRGAVRVPRSADDARSSSSTRRRSVLPARLVAVLLRRPPRREVPALRAQRRSHSLDKTDALESLQAFYATVVKGTPRPAFTWTFERDGSIKVVTKDQPEAVVVWQAVNPAARNFRHDVIGSAFASTPLTLSGPNTYVARVPKPAEGWTAFFVELKFPSGGKYPLTFTTAVRVLPDTLPYPAPKLSPPR